MCNVIVTCGNFCIAPWFLIFPLWLCNQERCPLLQWNQKKRKWNSQSDYLKSNVDDQGR